MEQSTLLTKLFYEENGEIERLSSEQFDEELKFIANQKEIDTMLTLFIVERLVEEEEIPSKFYDIVLSLLKYTPKNSIYNLRLLRCVLKAAQKNDKYVPLCAQIMKILKCLVIKNNRKIDVDWNTIKIGNDNAQSNWFVEFIVEKACKLLIQSFTPLLTCLGFPEISSFAIKQLLTIKIEGKSQKLLQSCADQIKKISEIALEFRSSADMKEMNIKNIKALETRFKASIEKKSLTNN